MPIWLSLTLAILGCVPQQRVEILQSWQKNPVVPWACYVGSLFGIKMKSASLLQNLCAIAWLLCPAGKVALESWLWHACCDMLASLHLQLPLLQTRVGYGMLSVTCLQDCTCSCHCCKQGLAMACFLWHACKIALVAAIAANKGWLWHAFCDMLARLHLQLPLLQTRVGYGMLSVTCLQDCTCSCHCCKQGLAMACFLWHACKIAPAAAIAANKGWLWHAFCDMLARLHLQLPLLQTRVGYGMLSVTCLQDCTCSCHCCKQGLAMACLLWHACKMVLLAAMAAAFFFVSCAPCAKSAGVWHLVWAVALQWPF